MKHIKRVLVILLALLLILSFTGCQELLDAMEDKELRGYTEAMLDAIAENDFDRGYALVRDVATEADFRSLMSTLGEIFADEKAYELVPLSVYQNRSITNGEAVDVSQATYMMTVGSARYIVEVATHSSYENLSTFYVSLYENTDYYSTGTLGAMEGANPFQWIMLLSNLIPIALTIFAFVDACRRKIKQKPLWIAIILVGFAAVGATLGPTQFNLNFDIGWLFKYSAMILYGGGTMLFRLMLPVGAILYFALRKKLVIEHTPEVDEWHIEENGAPMPGEPREATDDGREDG